jgi:hypothetical protein
MLVVHLGFSKEFWIERQLTKFIQRVPQYSIHTEARVQHANNDEM